MDVQRLRNLTTGRLHTQMADIYQDIECITGERGVLTHMLPDATKALLPYLREKAPDARLWDGEYDPAHVGEIDIPTMNSEEQAAFWVRFGGQDREDYARKTTANADIIAEVERLRAALRLIADHHDEQRALWRDGRGDYDAAIYHEDRRNVALFHLLNPAPSDEAEAG